MVNVRFFGILRFDTKVSSAMIEAENIDDLLKILDAKYDKINMHQLRNTIIFVNGVNMNELKRYRTKLEDGDEVLFLSPVSGG
ncbi:MAG: putative molybdopterin converting factor, subunit 1 [Clostridia bacterium]|nr:putative molybdopterin converting factor, subunit 1 [Clostridia bacterium]